MQCPKCAGQMTVKNSRQIDDLSRYRVYQCKANCGKWLSIEKLDKEPIKKEKKDEI